MEGFILSEQKSKQLLLVALKYMSETWQPMQILNPNQNVYYKSTKSIINELGQLITISSNLFKIILVWKDARLGIKNMRHVLRTVNKLMGSYHLSTKTESFCDDLCRYFLPTPILLVIFFLRQIYTIFLAKLNGIY